MIVLWEALPRAILLADSIWPVAQATQKVLLGLHSDNFGHHFTLLADQSLTAKMKERAEDEDACGPN